jgi:hypothetical protein
MLAPNEIERKPDRTAVPGASPDQAVSKSLLAARNSLCLQQYERTELSASDVPFRTIRCSGDCHGGYDNACFMVERAMRSRT